MKEYALYRGDEFITLGTREYLAEYLGVKPETITFWATPTHRKRIKNEDKCLIVIKIEDDDEDE